MKVRTDFITNSSSSSFVVTDARKGYNIPEFGDTLVAGSTIGETEFGWGPADIFDVGSRINFAYLQTTYIKEVRVGKDKKWLKMLEKVIKENTNVEFIIWNIGDDYFSKDGKDWGYIDHQSNSAEGENIDIFESKETLKDFIFGKGSYIHLDNDNH